MEKEAEYKTTTALVAQPTMQQLVQVIMALAPTMSASRMFGVTAEQAAVVMLKGHELGLGLATAFEFIHVIDSKPSISPKGMLALIHHSRDVDVALKRLEVVGGAFFGYQCTMKRRSSGIQHTAMFTLEDAKRADLIRPKSGWEKYPENMCMWRAIGFAADVVCPDLGGGMIRPEELGAVVDQNGEVIEGESKPIASPIPAVEIKPAATNWSLQSLVAKFGAEAVMAANEGRIPATDAEIAAIAGKLAANATA